MSTTGYSEPTDHPVKTADWSPSGTDWAPPAKAPVLNKDGTTRKRMGRPPKPRKPPGKPGRPRKGQEKSKPSTSDVRGTPPGNSRRNTPAKSPENPHESRQGPPSDPSHSTSETATLRPVEPVS